MCRVLKVSRSGYYSWQNCPESQRTMENRRLDAAIKDIYRRSKGRYGSPKITAELRDRGWWVGKNRVAGRMRKAALRSVVRRKFRPTTDSRHKYPVASNLLKRDFSANRPNQIWVSDITYIRTFSGWQYLTVFIDLFSRLVVGWALSSSLSHEMAFLALNRAIGRRKPPKGLVIHSDQGVQYACEAFTQAIKQHGFVQSMSRKGDCWDNAVAESFFNLLKSELVYQTNFFDKHDTQHKIFEYIEIFYNRERRHSTLNFMTPDQFEKINLELCA